MSQFVLLLHVIPERLQIISQLYDKNNVWECKLIFQTDMLQENIEITHFKPLIGAENIRGLRLLHRTVGNYRQVVVSSSGRLRLKG